MRKLKEITEELYPIACGKDYAPDDAAHEDFSMRISYRMANALHFMCLDCANDWSFRIEQFDKQPERWDETSRRRIRLWHELASGLIERICKAGNPELFATCPQDEFSLMEQVPATSAADSASASHPQGDFAALVASLRKVADEMGATDCGNASGECIYGWSVVLSDIAEKMQNLISPAPAPAAELVTDCNHLADQSAEQKGALK